MLRNRWLRRPALGVLTVLSVLGVVWMACAAGGPPAAPVPPPAAPVPAPAAFEQQVKPFLQKNCVRCHNEETSMAGVRVDQLDAAFEDRRIRVWEGIRHRISEGSMPPKGQPQPTAAERESMAAWITQSLEVARLRPAPKNGLVRRLTVAQYRNTLRELLQLDDDLTEALPPDAISADGFVNNKDTLQLSPLLLEAYLEIAGESLKRAIVDPKSKPAIQNFRVDLGAAINPAPLREQLILGANSLLLANKDFLVTQQTPRKPFAFDPLPMRTKYRFIEGYAGNDTVRGWRDYDSIYHAVFACMRGNNGYPKGSAYSTVPTGLLLRPAIPNDEIFTADGTYGPKANFKISLRELPDQGRFRVTVTAARYNDGLLLDPGAVAQNGEGIVVAGETKTAQAVTIPKAGVYQVDVYTAARTDKPVAPDSSRLTEGLAGAWPLDGQVDGGRLEGKAHFVESPFGRAVAFEKDGDAVAIPRQEAMNVGDGDFTVTAWIHPRLLRRAGIVALGGFETKHGWHLDLPGRGALRLQTTGAETQENGSVSSPPGVIQADTWQHVAAVVRRGKNETRLYVNGYAVAKGEIGPANLDNPKMELQLGSQFRGELDEVRLYRRALGAEEINGLLQPGLRFVKPPPPEKSPAVTLTLGDRQFSGTLQQPAFLAVRLEAGALPVRAQNTGIADLEKVVLTPLAAGNEVSRSFLAFEKRSPRVGVHVGLRRDCGSTLAPVGVPQTVSGDKPTRLVFEGAIRNFPSPDVEKDNVNYLAGVREIGVRSEYTDGRDMPRLLVRSVEFEGPFYETWPPASHRSIFVDSAQKSDRPAYARQIISRFAARAYRRPVTATEESALMTVYRKSFGAGGNFEGSIKDVLQVVLTSPQFLFLTETSRTPAPEALDPHELASKLSYFLWNGPPDRAALQLAATGTLRQHLDAQVDRMIEDPRFSQFTREFASQWLSLDKFNVLEPDRKRFPKLTRYARSHLRQEPVQFLQYLIQHNLPVRNLIDSDFVLANEVVASYYDLAEKPESGFQFVAIPRGRRELGGVLTQPAILAGLSDGRESNPVKRGAWLARKIIAEPPDPPPPNVPVLKESAGTLTLRQRLEQHRDLPACRQCHAKIDPWGVALEEFDAGGRLKQGSTDARSTLPDKTEVTGINDLRRYLGDDRIDQVAFSLLKHLATYATGRSLTYNELSVLKQDGLKLKASGYRMKDMVRFVAHSKLFLEK